MKKSLYATLGVDPQASEPTIQAAFEARLAAADPQDAIQLLALKEAWNVLKHPQRRAAYDAALLNAAETHAAPAGTARRRATRPATPSPRPRLGLWLGGAMLVLALGWMLVRPPKPPTRIAHAPQPVARRLAPPPEPMPSAPPEDPDTAAPSTAVLAPEDLFAQASTSVVRINVLNDAGEGVALGSGVVVDQGTVITNCHVAKAGRWLKVKHQAAEFDASVSLADEQHDLCRLSVPGMTAPAATLASVRDVRVGQQVYAIGSPQGLDLTLSDGMVSSLREGEDGPVIQTSAPVSPGSSGGGLFDAHGALIGIITFQMRSGQNLNFAVPVDWIGRMSSTTLPREARDSRAPSPAPTRTSALNPDILGTWHCFGPLTGRGMDFTLDERGQAEGQFDGKTTSGRYWLQDKHLTLMGHTFLVEELSPSRLVISKGQARRLACNH